MQGGGRGGLDSVPSHPPLRPVWRSKVDKVEKIVNVMAKIKAKCSGQLPCYNFYFVAFACILCSNNFHLKLVFTSDGVGVGVVVVVGVKRERMT